MLLVTHETRVAHESRTCVVMEAGVKGKSVKEQCWTHLCQVYGCINDHASFVADTDGDICFNTLLPCL